MAFRHHQARRASRARLALSLTALLWARHAAPVRSQVVVSGPPSAAAASTTTTATTATAATATTATTLELPSDPTTPPTETPAATDPPPAPSPPPPPSSEPTPSPSESQENNSGAPVPPSTAPPEALSPAAEPGQTRLRAQFRVSGVGASAAAADGREARSAFLDALAAGSSSPALPRSSLSVLRVAPAYVPLPSSDSTSKKKKRKARRRQLLLLDPIDSTADVLVEVNASSLNAGSASANAQAAYTSVRNAAYSGLIQTSLRGTGRRWAVVLTFAAPAAPGSELLPAPDDACESRFSSSSCLDGTGLTPAAAKGIIALGMLVVLLALAFAGVAWDRRARAVGFGGGGGSGGGGRGGTSGGGRTGTMADLAGSPRAAAAAAGLTAIPLPPSQANAMAGRAAAPGTALAIGEASSSGAVAGAISSGKIKAER